MPLGSLIFFLICCLCFVDSCVLFAFFLFLFFEFVFNCFLMFGFLVFDFFVSDNFSVSATEMNQQSSRSHCAFILHITGTNTKRNKKVEGCLNLVDLAGSERLKRSGATGAAAKETAAINKSLSALVDVFDAISKKRSHVPFRNSKLTYLMQSCLSGHGKTMMIVNVSPTTASGGETLCSLRFAKQVNQTELGRAKKHVSSNTSSSSSSSSSSNPRAPQAKRRAPLHGARDSKRQRR